MRTSSPSRTISRACASGALLLALAAEPAHSQQDAITVTATRVERPSLEVPASVDRVHGEDIGWARPQVNLSESLGRVPGIVVQNRQNYAQDLQISSRGFGARAAFGIRGIRIVSDGIPASFPDGQGQVSHFDLGSAERIEVLRGPFSVLYGNAAGGVINIVTGSGGRDPGAGAELALGSFGMRRAALKAGARAGAADWIVSASRFDIDGYRLHSAATREQLNAKLQLALAPASSLTLVANSFDSPETQDPLGMTRAQMNEHPEQAVAPAYDFDTRKSARQGQLGASFAHRFDAWRMEVSAYGGNRAVRQYLSIPLFVQVAPTHSGGVVDLDRDYGGGSLRFVREAALGGRPLTLTLGGEYERMAEVRKGFLNVGGSLADLKRDEDDIAASTGAYAQGEWRFAERWIALAGLRANRVTFRSEDRFVVPGNADDSGRASFSATTPVAGLLYRLAPAASLYAGLGRGFETPTFAELAYRSAGPGLNFALAAARSRHAELGVKAVLAGRLRLNAALFEVGTSNEIVVDTSSGGRTTFKNAGRTRRTGLELAAEAALPAGFEALLAWTRMEAKFRDGFASGVPPVAIAAGNTLPGVPRSTLHGELAWRHPPSGFRVALETQHRARVWVNDRNTEAADAFTLYNLAAGFTQQSGAWRFSGFLRLDNLTDRRYAGSVIVNEANGRYYEPAPGRNGFLGVTARRAF